MGRTILSWSSGKDAAWSLHALRQAGEHDVVGLLTTVTDGDVVTMHGVPEAVLRAQAEAVGLPLTVVRIPSPCPNEVYAARMGEAMEAARAAGVDTVAFGDLFLDDVRAYREANLARVGMGAAFPLWGRDTTALAREMVDGGLRATVVCVDTEQLDASFAGRPFDHALLDALPAGVDPCGERGELHTCAWDGPMFRHPVPLVLGAVTPGDRFARAAVHLAR